MMNDIFPEGKHEDELPLDDAREKHEDYDYTRDSLDDLKVSIYNEEETQRLKDKEKEISLDTKHEVSDLKAHIKPERREHAPQYAYEEMDEQQISSVANENRKLIESNMKNSVNTNPYIPKWLKKLAD
ncbi:hypothetical protein KBC03_04275 [Patescibacteria group bacterium]|nr:hypothetical protein [Patescibacteria group bacterium]